MDQGLRASLLLACGLTFGCRESTPAAQQAVGHHEHAAVTTTEKPPRAFDAPPPVGTQATCTVMDQVFTVVADTPRSEHDGKHFVFCCEGCKARFDQDPRSFTGS